MTNEWEGQPYKVYYFTAESPLQLEDWLERMLTEQNLYLITANGDYYIFKVMARKDEVKKCASMIELRHRSRSLSEAKWRG